MSVYSNEDQLNLIPAKIMLLTNAGGTLDNMNDTQHQDLLDYLLSRLKTSNVNRSMRLTRYAKIDRAISTWQKLSVDDSKREEEEDNTGRTQALPMNLPLLGAHLEDTVAFFAEVFSSQSRDFYTVPPEKDSAAAKTLADRMNQDTRARKYYKELAMGIRSLAKYNIGGYAVRWEEGGGQGALAESGNRIEAIDMYNFIWDSTVVDVSRIATEAEWSARITTKNRMWLERRALAGSLERVNKVLYGDEGNPERDYPMNAPKANMATFYKQPPTYVGLSMDASDERTSAGQPVDWKSYGASLSGDNAQPITGFEVVEMYCWLNAAQFGLTPDGGANQNQMGIDKHGNSYSLWRFTIVDSNQICAAEAVPTINGADPEIPHYVGFMTPDDMKEAQRSVMELLRPFQRFSSFLFNIFIAGARKNIWGLKGYDPSMFDMDKAQKGDVAGWFASKVPGRDVRTGIMTMDSNTGTDRTMEMLGGVMEIMQKLFPSQALPAQIAGIDRAVKNQVAAVMQGVQRRLHMVCKILDADIMSPMRVQCYRNLSLNDPTQLTGLTEEIVAKVLGSGLMQLNRESVASELKEMIYAVIQNSEAAAYFDLPKLFTYWSQMMDSPSDLGDFVKEQAVPGATPGAAVPSSPPDVMSASGLNGAPAGIVPGI